MALPNICCHPGDGAKALNRLPQLAKPRLLENPGQAPGLPACPGGDEA